MFSYFLRPVHGFVSNRLSFGNNKMLLITLVILLQAMDNNEGMKLNKTRKEASEEPPAPDKVHFPLGCVEKLSNNHLISTCYS